MSYILDALEKSNDARSRLGISHDDLRQHPQRPPIKTSRPHLPWIISIAALVGMVVVSFSSLPPDQSALSNPRSSTPTAPPPTIAPMHAGVTNREPQTKQPTPATKKDLSSQPADHSIKFAKKSTEALSSDQAPPIPDSFQQAIDALKITAHLYSSKPTDRLIIIDDKPLHERDSVGQGIRIDKITPNGAIFVQGRHQIHKPVFN